MQPGKHRRARSRIKYVACLRALVLCLFAVGCNRAAARIPGASLSFPALSTQYAAQRTYPFNVSVAMPIDQRAEHYDDRVAGTSWTGCKTDPFWTSDASSIVRDRLVTALTDSKLFSHVSAAPAAPGDLVLHSDLDAFCSQAVGFLFIRVAGITALNLTIERDGQILFQQKFERVVTDADPQYTGSQVAFIEQAMQVTMADSLRELLRDVLVELDRKAGAWAVANKPLQPTRAAQANGKREPPGSGPRG